MRSGFFISKPLLVAFSIPAPEMLSITVSSLLTTSSSNAFFKAATAQAAAGTMSYPLVEELEHPVNYFVICNLEEIPI